MHPDRKTRITREEAVKALQGFINRHFNQNRDNWSRASIPAHPEDNDILLSDYITQREAEVAALEQQLAAKDAEIARLRNDEYDQKAVAIIQNLSMLVRCLCHRHPNETLVDQALGYLRGEGLQGSPLRAALAETPAALGSRTAKFIEDVRSDADRRVKYRDETVEEIAEKFVATIRSCEGRPPSDKTEELAESGEDGRLQSETTSVASAELPQFKSQPEAK